MRDGFAAFHIDDGEIGIIANSNATFASHTENAVGAVARQIDKALQRKLTRIDVIEHDWHQRLNAGHSRRRSRVRLLLFVQRMWCMVGAEYIDNALINALPNTIAMALFTHRWVHLDKIAKRRIFIRRQRKVMRSGFTGCHILVTLKEIDFFGCRDMQDVNTCAGFAGDTDKAFGALQCSGNIAPDRVARRITFNTEIFALLKAEFVFRMEGGTAARTFQDRTDAFIILNQQIACRRSHEHLDASRTWQALKLGNVFCIVPRSANPEGKIAMHTMTATANLVVKRFSGSRQWFGVRHFENRCHTAQNRSKRTCFQIFLVLQPRLTKMHLTVNNAGQNMQTGTIDDFTGRTCCKRANRLDAPVTNTNVPLTYTVVIDDGCTFQDCVERLGHCCLLLAEWDLRAFSMRLT